MSDQLLAVTKEMVAAPINFRGLHGYCTGYTGSRRGSVYVSLIGRVTAVTGIWAAFMDNVELSVLGGRHLRKRPKLDGATYHTLRVRLPESDWLHLVLLHTQASMQNLPGEPFFILSATPDPPLDAFWIEWGNAVALPALRKWVPQLWARGEGRSLIHAAPAMGTHCWWVSADERKWGELIQQIVKGSIPG
jgi:hypothetical protein